MLYTHICKYISMSDVCAGSSEYVCELGECVCFVTWHVAT